MNKKIKIIKHKLITLLCTICFMAFMGGCTDDKNNEFYSSDIFVDDEPKYNENPYDDFMGDYDIGTSGLFAPTERNYDSYTRQYNNDELQMELLEDYYEYNN